MCYVKISNQGEEKHSHNLIQIPVLAISSVRPGPPEATHTNVICLLFF